MDDDLSVRTSMHIVVYCSRKSQRDPKLNDQYFNPNEIFNIWAELQAQLSRWRVQLYFLKKQYFVILVDPCHVVQGCWVAY